MKSLLFTVLALTQFSAFATSRTPEVYCVAQDGSVDVSIFNDVNRERESEVRVFTGEGFKKFSTTTVARRDVSESVNFLGEDFGLSIDQSKVVKDGFSGKLYSSYSDEAILVVCRLSSSL